MMTHEQLLAVVHYDMLTGVFTRTVRDAKMMAGTKVGCLVPDGYIVVQVLGERWLAHRLAVYYVTGVPPDPTMDVDHENRVRSDNQWNNIRVGTRSFNLQNQTVLGRKSKSGFLGVGFHKAMGKWTASVEVNGKTKVTYHKNIEDAKRSSIALRVQFYPGFVSDQVLTVAPSREINA